MMEFIPFHRIQNLNKDQVVIVDALHPDHLTLSHWKGANKYPKIAADTSAEITINAIQQGLIPEKAKYVSANHFDIDGFVGVFALLHPHLLPTHSELLIQMAEIGDFRHFNPNDETSEKALKLCLWVNAKEKELFYVPFGRRDEIRDCVPKFGYFLSHFYSVLENIESATDYLEEFYFIQEGFQKIKTIRFLEDIKMQIVKASEPLPYYTLFSGSEQADLVLSIYDHQRYELEYKYTTWVDIVSRPVYPRIDLRPLAKELNAIEQSAYLWSVDQITDTGPILRLEKKGISKAERFADPNERDIYSSSIEEELFVEICTTYLNKKLKSIQAKNFWTWEETKAINAKA